MIRIGAAAAPRWWSMDPTRRPAYLDHLAASGATSVEFIVHHGAASRDPASVHLDRSEWASAVAEAVARGLHVDVHNSLEPRFRLERWDAERSGFSDDVAPVLDLLADIEQRQGAAPALVVHAAVDCLQPEATTAGALRWMTAELERRRASATVCLELRAGSGVSDVRLDRDRQRLTAFISELAHPSVGLCWDVANEWLTFNRVVRPYPGTNGPLPRCLRHVHLHSAIADGLLHAPLADGNVPWAEALTSLVDNGWCGSVTLEIRYRLAHDVGDPWTVLADSIRRALSVER